jgi:glycerol-3-phosphate O-acyltransferase
MEDIKKNQIYMLEGEFGPLLRPILKRLFSQMNIPELYRESISSLSEKGHIVYAHSTKSTVDALLINYRFKKDNLPVPQIIFQHKFIFFQPVRRLGTIFKSLFTRSKSPFENNFYKDFIQHDSCASLLFLDKRPSRSQPDPILELMKIQRDLEKPIYIVPQRIIYNRSPLKVKDATKEEKTNILGIRKITTLVMAQEHGFIEHGEPINLKEVMKQAQGESKFFEDIVSDIRNDLMHRLAMLGRNISGAPIRDRMFIIKKTIKDPILQSYLGSYASENKKKKDDLEHTVFKHLDQIASDLSPSTINILSKTLSWIFNNIYDGVDMNLSGLQSVKDMARKGSLVYVPCHKSHIDYLILSYCLFQNWMSVPVIAAGINLAFFPISSLLRRGGAFFMKRTFKDNPLYSQTFAAYVRTILQERIPMEFFIEGTRSRSGKLMLPKKGLLSMIIRGWESGVSRDVIFVPVYVGYDTVAEEKAYIREMKGDPKEKENFWQLIKAGKVLKNRYGKVYIRFAEPISLNEFMKGKTSYSQMDTIQKEDLYDIFAQEIIGSIYQQTVATPFSILSCVVTSHTSATEEQTIQEGFQLFVDYLKYFGCNLASSLSNEVEAYNEAYAIMKEKKLITIDEGESDEDPNLIIAEGENRIHLEYYKNTILNFFVPASLICNVLLKYPGGIDEKTYNEQVKNLSALLENEFILDTESFKKAQQFMLDNKILMISKNIYSISESNKGIAVMFDGLIENYLESYLSAAKFLLKTKDLGKKDPLKVINRYASRMYKKGEIKRYEALCLPVYKGALDTFRKKNLVDAKNTLTDDKALEEIINNIEAYLED